MDSHERMMQTTEIRQEERDREESEVCLADSKQRSLAAAGPRAKSKSTKRKATDKVSAAQPFACSIVFTLWCVLLKLSILFCCNPRA
jgi:hypothetical protein